MREILFRGKRVDNNEWVYGYIVNSLQFDGWFIDYNKNSKDNSDEVNYESIGQFTGLLDKNGSKIFEGDVIDYNNTISGEIIYNSQFCRFEIVHKEPRKKTYLPFIAIDIYQIEIIGNIHEDGNK